jgi:N-acetylmuramoyl-L-alanine amidase CwlA
MGKEAFIKKIGEKAKEDYQKNGILASVTIAQACLESEYGTSELAMNANNLFGMKTILSGNNWKSVWDGKSKYTKNTKEEQNGKTITISADFRKYNNIDLSIQDHSLYLLQAKNGNELRYKNITKAKSPKEVIQIIKDGGYATDSNYVNKVLKVIDEWDLTKYDERNDNMSINITKNTSTANTTKLSNRDIDYIVIHYTAGTTSKKGTANNTAEYFSRASTRASADFICDDSTIVQFNPDISNRYTWAVGGNKYSSMSTSLGGKYYGKCKNSNSISIEMCSNKTNKKSLGDYDTDWYLTEATINNAVELTKYLMDKYNIKADHVIMHHQVTGKLCPQPWVLKESSLKGWYSFLEKIGSKTTATKTTSSKTSTTKTTTNSSNNTSYKVRVTAKALNIRKGAGTSYAITGVIKDKGIYTIVEEKNGWGLLKSGTGWIKLSYTKKL